MGPKVPSAPTADHVARAVREARAGLQLSMRDVEGRTAQMKAEAPELYEIVGRNVLSEVELLGEARLRKLDHRGARALLNLLFGSVEAFAAQTGVDLHLSAAGTELPVVPVVDEGAVATPHLMLQQAPGEVGAPVVGAAYAVRVGTEELIPLAYPGQLVYMRASDREEPGRLSLLHRHGRLQLAVALGGGRWATMQGARAFELRAGDAVLGHAVSIEPRIPAAYLVPSAERTRAAG